MASGDTENVPKYMAYSASNIPLLGALVDYMTTSIQYFKNKTLAEAEKLHVKKSQIALSVPFMTITCLLLGLVCNVKFEVVTNDEEPLVNDLHFVIMSKEDNLYIDDIDATKVILCLEASDTLVIIISTMLIWRSSYSSSLLREYFFLPWFGATLRGVFLRQAPTAGALLYTMAVVNGSVNLVFLSTFCFLLMLEARLWLEIARVVRIRWEKRGSVIETRTQEVETLWSKEDVQSVEVGNFVY